MTEEKRGIIVSDAIHKEVSFKTSPQHVYDALLDAKQFSRHQLSEDNDA
jgi:uncharacterized protein YndB with AHSA1/START domain